MEIRITDGDDVQVLCDGPVRGVNKAEGPSDFRVRGPVTAQVANRLRATGAKVFNRGNLAIDVSWSVIRECGSVGLAQRFILTHQRDVLREHTLQIIPAGQPTLSLSDAVLEDVSAEMLGLCVVIHYRVKGGTLS